MCGTQVQVLPGALVTIDAARRRNPRLNRNFRDLRTFRSAAKSQMHAGICTGNLENAVPRRQRIPRYCLHKPSGQAVVFINRTQRYLGPYDSPESREAYGNIVASLAQGRSIESATLSSPPVKFSVSDLLLRFFTEELPRFSEDEQRCQMGAIRIVRKLFGETPADEFGPLKLRLVRDEMVKGDPHAVDADGNKIPRKPWSRGYVNKQLSRVISIFRWGISWELVPQSVADALATVRPLRKGETMAVDYKARRAVPPADIKAVRAKLSDRQRDIFDLLLLTGARPGELIDLKIGGVDRSGDVWRADLEKHKTANKEKSRTLFFNSVAQAILLRHMRADPEARFFPVRRDTFCVAVKTACIKAGVPVFTPHWLRHTVATELADEMGTEAAQRLLGHAGKAMTEHYSKAAERLAMKAAVRLGVGG